MQTDSCQIRVTGKMESGLTDYPDYDVDLVVTVPLRDIFAAFALAGLATTLLEADAPAGRIAYTFADSALAQRKE
jgi:hypothetical protein